MVNGGCEKRSAANTEAVRGQMLVWIYLIVKSDGQTTIKLHPTSNIQHSPFTTLPIC